MNPSRWAFFELVSDNAPSVRPWNDPKNEMNFCLRVWNIASLRAVSIASAPLLAKCVFVGPSIGTISLSFLPSSGMWR